MNSQKMQPTKLKQESLSSLNGYWKVLFHGGLKNYQAIEKTPRITIYFGKLANQTNPTSVADFRTTEIKAIDVAAAELMRLPLNVVIKDCKIAFDPNKPLPSEGVQSFCVDLSKAKMTLFNRYDNDFDGNPLIKVRPGRTPAQNCDGGKAYFVGIEQDGNPYALIVPCSEVFRFFYCTSSKLAYTFLSPRILEPDKYMINISRTGISEKNPEIASIGLRQWMLNNDRRHLARLFFTEGAFNEAKQIFLRLIGAFNSGYERALIAYPPEHGVNQLLCIYRPCEIHGGSSHFVTRILQSDWSLDFKQIDYSRDNDNEKTVDKEMREKLDEYGRKPLPNMLAVGTEIHSLKNEAASKDIAEFELMDHDFKDRFPELSKIYSSKIKKEEQISRSASGKPLLQLADGSLIEGSTTVENNIVNIMLQTMQQYDELEAFFEENNSPLDDYVESNYPDRVFTQFDITLKLLDKAKKHYKGRLEVEPLDILDRKLVHNGNVIINLLPPELDGKKAAWFFIDSEKKLTRGVLILRLNFDGKIRYYLDFMHKDKDGEDGKDTAQLVIWHPSNQNISNGFLRYIILTCMRNGSVNLKNGMIIKNYLCGNKFNHFRKEKRSIKNKQNAKININHIKLIEKKIFLLENKILELIYGKQK